MNYNHINSPKAIPGVEWSKHSPRNILQYAVGALLYSPGNHTGIGGDICAKRYPRLKTIALCLEDSVLDSGLADAEHRLVDTMGKIHRAMEGGTLSPQELPLIWIRVRSAGQMRDIYRRMGEAAAVLTGFILPKFDSGNREAYSAAVRELNKAAESPVYIMPIIESGCVIRRGTRFQELAGIKDTLDSMREYVLNVRVGGHDFCNIYGLRRNVSATIYDVAVVRSALEDIINVFGGEYVISAPVWEYFGDEGDTAWRRGLEAELAMDKLNGFVGKTAIHPSQLEVIQEAFAVEQEDYRDALSVAGWGKGSSGVEKSAAATRMNEKNVHTAWAEKTLALAAVYGVKE